MQGSYSFTSLPASLHGLLDEQARKFRDRVYVTCDGQELSYGDLAELSSSFAARLISAGVQPEDRVMLLMPGSLNYLALWFAIARTGAVESPVNPAYKGLLLRQLIETSAPKICIIEDAFVDEFAVAAEGFVSRERIVPLSIFVAGAPGPQTTVASATIRPRDTAAIIFTSGTTGRSKGVMVSHRQELAFGQAFAEITGLTEDDVTYDFLPFFHIAAKFIALATMLTGARMVLRPTFSVSNFWSDVKTNGVTVCQAVGGLCHMLFSQPPASSDGANPMRMIYTVPMPWEFKTEFEARFGLTLVEGYGGTESNLVAYSRPDEATPRGSCGRASPHFELAIQDEEGNPSPPGAAGEICVRPRYPSTTMNGYFGVPDKSLEVMSDLWFHTGDRGLIDERGYVYFLDRLKDAIRRRGENISSFEIERILNSHPAVAESAVIPVPSELGEDEVKAVIVWKASIQASEEEIFRFATENMPYFMVPRYVEVRNELPRTPTMKIKKAELKAEGNDHRTWDCEKAGLRITRRGLEVVRITTS